MSSSGASVLLTLVLAAAHVVAPRASVAADEAPAAPEKDFIVRPALGVVQLSFNLSNEQDDELEFEPNAPLVVGLKVGYRRYQLSGTISTGVAEDAATHGRTSFLDFQLARAFRVARRELVVGLFFQRYRGFHLANLDEADPSAEAEPFILPDMRMQNAGGTLTYFLNPDFSYDDAFLEYAPRAAGSGSWALRCSLGNMLMDTGGTPLLPPAQRLNFGLVADLTALQATYASLGGGYAHDWRFGRASRYLLALALMVGLDVAVQAVTIGGATDSGLSLSPGAAMHLSFAYVGETVHAGIFAFADLETTKVEDATAQVLRGAAMAFIGVRF